MALFLVTEPVATNITSAGGSLDSGSGGGSDCFCGLLLAVAAAAMMTIT